MKSIFRLENISKSYTDKTYIIKIIENLFFEINSGDMLAITGPSGSGKSTLLHIMGLLDNADTGKLFFNEREISVNDKNIELFRNNHIGFVFQFHYLLSDFNALENVALPAVIAGKSWHDAKKKASELLYELDMKKRFNHYPNQLSGGEQQRIAIARALINQPELIIADEPTGNLDKQHSEEIVHIFEKLNQEHNQTLIIATHDLEIAQKMPLHYHLENKTLTTIKKNDN
ncbi:MAG: ABC transporter ATP-binding protein [Candidatus Cloacimonetes bacterium]|jgi:ABC-type lipoprotein export system ATPase subunit|nr:ABC transporter ATP-binding protein [Candidatus Cloacimonadota bacterium]MDD4155113.1 ABC transporter ATP-binding protein [Candidatus Cloacimonadota bacterium]